MLREEDSSERRSGGEVYQPKVNEVAQNFLADLEKERSRLTEDFPLCAMLIEEAFDRVYSTGRIPGREFYADVLQQRPMKLTQKIFVPVKQYPKFNFIGKLLGPKGNSLKRLHEVTQCKISIKGRNSMRDRVKEEELGKSNDPRYSHLNKDMFLEISSVAPPAECYSRIAYALSEIRKYLIPDKNDEISHEQLRETMDIDPEAARTGYGGNFDHKSVLDKSEGLKRYSKYVNALQYASDDEREDYHEYREHSAQLSKRPPRSSHGYEYMRAPPSSSGYKRSSIPSYDDYKHFREVTVKKPSYQYGIVKKYK